MTCLATSVAGHAAMQGEGKDEVLTSSEVFRKIPLEVLDMIRPSTRLDMLDYCSQADSLLTVADALGGSSRFEQVTDDYLKVSVTPVSTLEIKLLPYKKGQIVMTLYTTGGEGMAKDTEVSFFDADLKPLPKEKFIKTPDMKRFFSLKKSDITGKELEEMIPFEAVEFTTGPGDSPLTATFTTLSILPQETREMLSPQLIPVLTSPWTGQFKFQK